MRDTKIPPKHDHVVLYDRNCGFCRRLLTLLLRWDDAKDRRLRPVALQSREAADRLVEMPEDERMASWHLACPGGKIISGGRAIPPVLKLVGRHRFSAALMRRMPRLTDWGYRWVANHRAFVGRATKRWPMFHVPTEQH
jgi:predicted DCC family thiol-disulfide oxidoreductase YuxK